MSPCPSCGGGYAGRYGPEALCWVCWAQAHGGERSIPEPIIEDWTPREITSLEVAALRARPHGISLSTVAVIEIFAGALGPPIGTPEWTADADGNRVRARYRVFRWPCPSCGSGMDDPTYRPLCFDSGGRVFCQTCDGSAEEIGNAVKREMAA